MYQCAQAASGKWLLYTDADTEHEVHSVSSSVHYAEEHKLDLLTLSARCVCKSWGEHLVQPMGIGCFSVWFRLPDVNNPDSDTPLACGQYLLIRNDVYKKTGGNSHVNVRSDVTEDLALFQLIKKKGYNCELSIGSHLFATRMYQSFKESWIGWRRIYLHALKKNVPSLMQKIFMLLIFSFLPFFIWTSLGIQMLMGQPGLSGSFTLSSVLCGLILFMRSRSHLALKTNQWSIMLHPFSALVIIGILIDGLWHHFGGKKVEWKMQKY